MILLFVRVDDYRSAARVSVPEEVCVPVPPELCDDFAMANKLWPVGQMIDVRYGDLAVHGVVIQVTYQAALFDA